MKTQERATPQGLALEIISQTRGTQSQSMTKRRVNGEPYTLDTLELARRTAQRMAECGTFPRGKVTLTYPSGKTKALGAHQCNTRICPRCSYRRGKRLGDDMLGALNLIEEWGWRPQRTRFATLTIPNAENADAAIDKIMAAWHRTLATKTWNRLIAGGFRAVEVKPGKDGRWNVHLHAIVFLWTEGVPYKLIRKSWDQAAGGKYNQRYDELRTKARAHPGESKAQAAARYLVKYLVKTEEAKQARKMPGKMPHMLGAIYGRRLFGAWGLGAAALRIERRERPSWERAYNKHLEGYVEDGERPESATLETPWMNCRIEIPRPALPPAFRLDEVPEQLEPSKTKRTMQRVGVQTPLGIYRWRDLPSASKLKGKRTELAAWLENSTQRAPARFRWGTWYKSAPRTWTDQAEALLGERTRTSMGAAIWSRREKPSEGYPDITRPEHIVHQLIKAQREAIHTARAHLCNACTDLERRSYLDRMPEQIRQHLEETSWL